MFRKNIQIFIGVLNWRDLNRINILSYYLKFEFTLRKYDKRIEMQTN